MSNKGRKFPAESLRRAEVVAMLDVLSGDRPETVRNRALIVLLWRTGLRVAEATALREIDVDLTASTVRVLSGKGGKARTVGIDPAAADEVGRWMDVRRSVLNPPARAPLFCTKDGGEMWTSYVRAMVRRVAAEAGIERRVHPHALRHTFAVEMAREGMPAVMIQRLLGHSNLGTTTTYLASLSPEEAIELVRRRPSW